MWGNISKVIGNMGGMSGIGKAVWGSKIGRQAVYGAVGGGMYGAFSNNSSILGGAVQGAGVAAMVGGAKGLGMKASIATGALVGSNPLVGGAMGAGLYSGARYGAELASLGRRSFSRLGRTGNSWNAAMGSGRIMARKMMRDGRGAARHIGNTADKGYNTFRSLFV